MSNKLKFFLVLVFFVGLIVILKYVIMPYAQNVAASDLFLDGSSDNPNPMSISNNMTDAAFRHCNRYIREELDDEVTVNFPNQPLHAWGIGSYSYVINSEVEILGKDGVAKQAKYVCRIKFDEGKDPENYEDWSVYGVDGIDDL